MAPLLFLPPSYFLFVPHTQFSLFGWTRRCHLLQIFRASRTDRLINWLIRGRSWKKLHSVNLQASSLVLVDRRLVKYYVFFGGRCAEALRFSHSAGSGDAGIPGLRTRRELWPQPSFLPMIPDRHPPLSFVDAVMASWASLASYALLSIAFLRSDIDWAECFPLCDPPFRFFRRCLISLA